jgi:very-short-patch-repair endonuclease
MKEKLKGIVRTHIINQLGIKVLRLRNEEVENVDMIENLLKDYL